MKKLLYITVFLASSLVLQAPSYAETHSTSEEHEEHHSEDDATDGDNVGPAEMTDSNDMMKMMMGMMSTDQKQMMMRMMSAEQRQMMMQMMSSDQMQDMMKMRKGSQMNPNGVRSHNGSQRRFPNHETDPLHWPTVLYGHPRNQTPIMTPELVTEYLQEWLDWHNNPRLKLGQVTEVPNGNIHAVIATVDGSIVQVLGFNRHPGLFWQIVE